MDNKHSPGPWTFKAWGNQILDARKGDNQCLVAVVQVNTYRDEGRHNADLIAAAPELLEDLQEAAVQAHCGCGHPACTQCERDRRWAETIAKATHMAANKCSQER